LAAVGAVATLVAQFHVVVERSTPPSTGTADGPGASATDASVGATEDQVDMQDTADASAHEAAGSGKNDSLGG
jgi:hypothetical protein